MVNDYDTTVRALHAFILANCPAGGYNRDLERLRLALEEGKPLDWVSVDLKPYEGTGAILYVRLDPATGRFSSSRSKDAEGNEWSSYKVCCEVSWPSWGADGLDIVQKRLDVMNATLAFAKAIEAAFPNVINRLDATAAEVQLREVMLAKERAKRQVIDFVKLHAKGMKVGQEKIVPVPTADFTKVCPIEVEREECGRRFKYRAEATSLEGFSFVRLA